MSSELVFDGLAYNMTDPLFDLGIPAALAQPRYNSFAGPTAWLQRKLGIQVAVPATKAEITTAGLPWFDRGSGITLAGCSEWRARIDALLLLARHIQVTRSCPAREAMSRAVAIHATVTGYTFPAHGRGRDLFKSIVDAIDFEIAETLQREGLYYATLQGEGLPRLVSFVIDEETGLE